ncbi:hypothetical protein KC460_02470 [Candidatus Dependentiae bacterium]|nr:hypothetical protein [Candidatus Dependentiae bacterium]
MIYFIIFLFLLTPHLESATVGSEVEVSKESNVTYSSKESDNEVVGFTAFDDGFKLENSATRVTYNSLFPVSGSITLNGGILELSKDLLLGASFDSVGKIDGNFHAVRFTTTGSIQLPSGIGRIVGGIRFIDNYIDSSAIISVDWSFDDEHVLSASSNGIVRAYNFDGEQLLFDVAEQQQRSVYGARFLPIDSYHFAKTAKGNVVGIEIYNPDTNSLTITDVEKFVSGKCVVFNKNGTYLAVGSSVLSVYSYSNGQLTFVNSVATGAIIGKKAISWDSTGNYIAVGLAVNKGAELKIYNFNGSKLTLDSSVDIGKSVQAIDWMSGDSFIAVGFSDSANNISVFKHNAVSKTLTNQSGAQIVERKMVNSLHWNSDGNFLAVGLAYSSDTSEVRVYEFDKKQTLLTLKYELDTSAGVNDIRWSHNDKYLVWGDSNYEVNIYEIVGPENPSGNLIFKNAKITFNSNVTLKNKVCFEGNCTVKGNGYIIDLDSQGAIIVDSRSSLLLCDATLKGVVGTNVRCLDSSSTLSLANIIWMQEQDYTFTSGYIDIVGDVAITGTHTFSYQSDQQSTIFPYTKVFFDKGMTLSYDPKTVARDLLAMIDQTSILHLYDTVFHSTETGLQLTRGTLVIEGNCFIKSDASVLEEGINFGDGIYQSNNLYVRILPESCLDIKSGFLVYKNV